MATINLSENNDVIIPTNDDTTYRGLKGNDTYILVSQENSSSISVVDTEGENVMQLPEWSKIKSIVVAKTALKITCDDMTVFTINGADKFSYDVGGNLTSSSTGIIKTFSEFVSIFELTPPSTGTVNKSTNKIVYEDTFRVLYEVKVQKEDNGNKYYLNNELSPDLSLKSGEKYVFDLNESLKLKPFFMMKSAFQAPTSIDASVNMLYNEKIELGVTYRLEDSFGAMVNFAITPELRIGYAYDHIVSDLNVATSASHEFILLYDIRFGKKVSESPRFF